MYFIFPKLGSSKAPKWPAGWLINVFMYPTLAYAHLFVHREIAIDFGKNN